MVVGAPVGLRRRLRGQQREGFVLVPRRPNLTEVTDLSEDDATTLTGELRLAARVMLDLWVDDIQSEQAKLEAAGVTFSRNKELEFWGGVILGFLRSTPSDTWRYAGSAGRTRQVWLPTLPPA